MSRCCILFVLTFAACAHVRPPAELPVAVRSGADRSSADRSGSPAASVPTSVHTSDGVARDVLAAMDRSIDPCSDFYRYACGGWLDKTELPGDQTRWGRGFSEIRERNLDLQREILEELAAGAASDVGADVESRKVGRFYASCMDEAAVEAEGIEPLRPLLNRIDSARDLAALFAVAGELQMVSADALLGAYVDADYDDPTVNILHIAQGGLGLPDRDYYLDDDEDSRALLSAYESHVARMLMLAGADEGLAGVEASRIVAFETELAKLAKPRAELRDPDKNYHRLDRAGLESLTPKLPWSELFTAIGQPQLKPINVATPEFFTGLEKLMIRTPLSDMQSYMRWHLINATAALLPRALDEEHFAFFGQRLRGQKEQRSRWKRCVSATDDSLGEAFARAFIARAFAGDSKRVALDMIADIEQAFIASLPQLEWMDDTTRQRAIEKMDAILNKIGYPERWRDYGALDVRDAPYAVNGLAGRRFEVARLLAKVGNRVDRDEWFMTPPTVNAYYNPSVNEIVFPAGILQAPFFSRDFPAAMNYGGIGMVMGHEVTHGFDDQGRKFDHQGRMHEWWEPEVSERFEAKAKCVEELYETYEIQPGLALNGKLTLGENIADLGGLKASFGAYRAWRARQDGAAPAPAVEGLTDEQLFFVAYAQTWCSLATPEVERTLVKVDPHSPPRFRVNGPVSHLPEFSEVFSCEVGEPMRPAHQCVVW